jgi:hypothetical protein
VHRHRRPMALGFTRLMMTSAVPATVIHKEGVQMPAMSMAAPRSSSVTEIHGSKGLITAPPSA